MTICFFTATGNSLYVARGIGGNLLSIPHLMKQEQIEISDDAVGVVCPCYAGEMPRMVRAFLARAKIETVYFFFIYTYGMAGGEALAHARTASEAAGLRLNYANAIQMVDNYLPGFEMQNQIDTLYQKDVEGQLTKVCREIAERKEKPVHITVAVKARMATLKRMFADRILKADTAQRYLVNDRCIHCGICARVCPADNITVTETEVRFSDRCEVCYACLHNCPQNAIHMRQEKSDVRFRNEEVTLNDLIQANE